MLLINNNCLLCSPPHQAAAAVGAGSHRLLWDPKSATVQGHLVVR